MTRRYDLAIIGGGINGCGIARYAAGWGLSVFLCEQGDLGSGTSSASTKLIHGGLRYLEHYDFKLVRHALTERERLWAIAPHIIWPLRFVLPHRKGLRPAWMLRLGLFIYDHLGGRKLLPATTTLRTLAAHLRRDYPFLSEKEARRLVRHYGTDARFILGKAQSPSDLGRDFGGSLTEAEVLFLVQREFALTAADIVWRRTKSGLWMTGEEIETLDLWLAGLRKELAEPLLKQAG